MARRRNYVTITNGSSRDENGAYEEISLIIGFYKPDGEMVDVLSTEFDYICNREQDMIQRWIYDGVSPVEYEENDAIAQLERDAYAKPYNR